MEKIDNLDKKILEIITANARIPFKDVAEECGVSRAAIHQRVQRLIDLGVIVGSGYHVDPKMLGYSTCTYVGVILERGSMYKRVVEELNHIPEVVECHFTTGPYTMLIKLYACDNAHLMELLNNRLQEIPGVISTETLISLEQSINKEIPSVVNKKQEVSRSRCTRDISTGKPLTGATINASPDSSPSRSSASRATSGRRDANWPRDILNRC